jgi:hypothetical protein
MKVMTRILSVKIGKVDRTNLQVPGYALECISQVESN